MRAMSMGMSMSGGTYDGYLNASAVDFNNATQVQDFLHDLKHMENLPILGSLYARNFWYGVIVVLVVTSVINRTWSSIRAARLRDAVKGKPSPASPKRLPVKILAILTSICRELSYPQRTPNRLLPWLQIPTHGQIYVISAYFAFILALEFINNDVPGAAHWQFLGVRAGWLAAAQIPLLIALAGKINLIGMFCGISYVRLNIYHRWVSRGLLLLSTFHLAFQNHGWDIYQISKLEWDTDGCPKKGITAYAFILWMNLSTMLPLRYLSYEIFVIQHIFTFVGFIVAISYHLDDSPGPASQQYIYAGVGIFLVTIIVRLCRYVYLNIRPGRVSVEVLPGQVSKLRVHSRLMKAWKPGAHVLLSIPYFGFDLSHPATILSMPTSHNGDLVLLLKARRGFTKRLLNKSIASTSPIKSIKDAESGTTIPTYLAFLDGPYSSSVPDLHTFDSVLLIAGGTGITFTIAQLLSLAYIPGNKTLPLRKVVFYWIIKEKAFVSWIGEELQTSIQKLQKRGIQLGIEVYITCDSQITESEPSGNEQNGCENLCSCSTDNQPGESEKQQPCCCAPSTAGPELSVALGIDFKFGRPSWDPVIQKMVLEGDGEIAVATCGPVGLTQAVGRSVARVSEDFGKGSIPRLFLHVENS